MFNMLIQTILVIGISYLAGSIPTGYILVKRLTGQDIRETGSGSTGATNVKRILGKKYFFYVLLLDALKGILPVIYTLAYTVEDPMEIYPVLSAVFVILGHSKSIFLNFKGGKSVASGIGTIIALNPMVGLCTAIVWAIVTWSTKFVSVGSIVAFICSIFFMYKAFSPLSYIYYVILAAIYVIFLHKDNIKRLINGEENKVRE